MAVTPEVASSSLVGPANPNNQLNNEFPFLAGACLQAGRWLRQGFLQHVCKRGGLIEGPHRLAEPTERRVEVSAGLPQRRLTEHLLHVVHGPSGVEQARASLLTEVVIMLAWRHQSRCQWSSPARGDMAEDLASRSCVGRWPVR